MLYTSGWSTELKELTFDELQFIITQPNYFFDKLRGNGLNLVAMEGGPKVDQIRKLFHEEMAPRAIPQYRELQTSNAYITALRLIQATEKGETVADVVEKYVSLSLCSEKPDPSSFA